MIWFYIEFSFLAQLSFSSSKVFLYSDKTINLFLNIVNGQLKVSRNQFEFQIWKRIKNVSQRKGISFCFILFLDCSIIGKLYSSTFQENETSWKLLANYCLQVKNPLNLLPKALSTTLGCFRLLINFHLESLLIPIVWVLWHFE